MALSSIACVCCRLLLVDFALLEVCSQSEGGREEHVDTDVAEGALFFVEYGLPPASLLSLDMFPAFCLDLKIWPLVIEPSTCALCRPVCSQGISIAPRIQHARAGRFRSPEY